MTITEEEFEAEQGFDYSHTYSYNFGLISRFLTRTATNHVAAITQSADRVATYHRGGQASALAFDGDEYLSLPVDDDPTSISIWVRDHGDWEIVVDGETATEPMNAHDTVIRRGGEATTSRQNESDTLSGGAADTIIHLAEIDDTQYVDGSSSPFPRRFWMVDGGTLDAPRWGSSLGKSVAVDDIRTYDRELTT